MTVTIPDQLLWLLMGMLLLPLLASLRMAWILYWNTDWRYQGKWRREERRAKRRHKRLAKQYGEHGRMPPQGQHDEHPGLFEFVCGSNTFDDRLTKCQHEDANRWTLRGSRAV
jgi:hypothetical protein